MRRWWGGKRRSRVILQVRMKGIHPRNPAESPSPLKCTSHLGFSLGLRQEGLSIRETAARFGLGRSAVTDVSKCGTAVIAASPDELAQAMESNP